MSKTFGEILKEAREKRTLTALEFSKMIGIPQSTLSRLETNKAQKISAEKIFTICQTLDIDANELFGIKTKKIKNSINMKKAEELKKALEDVKEKFQKLVVRDKRINEILDLINYFTLKIEPDSGRIKNLQAKCLAMEGTFEEDEMHYGLIMMSLFCKLYYKCRVVTLEIQEEEYCIEIDTLLLYIGRVLREQALYNISENIKLQAELFYEEFREFVEMAIESLLYKYSTEGHLTNSYNSEEADKLESIRAIYETIHFNDITINYFDYITKAYKTVSISNVVEIQYMVMNLYAKAYTESRLLLEKDKTLGSWTISTSWQIIIKLEILIQKYFF